MPDLIDLYAEDLKRRGRMDSSISVMTNALRTVADDCGPLESLTGDSVVNWLDTRRTNRGTVVASNTRWGYISGLNRFYSWATETGHLDRNPVDGMAKPEIEESVHHSLTAHELERAIVTAQGELRCWIIAAAYQGLRPKEVAYLERTDIDDEAVPPTLTVRGTGRSPDRTMELHSRTLEAFESLPMPDAGRLFPSITIGAMSTRINRHLISLGIQARSDALRTWYKSDEYWRHDASQPSTPSAPSPEGTEPTVATPTTSTWNTLRTLFRSTTAYEECSATASLHVRQSFSSARRAPGRRDSHAKRSPRSPPSMWNMTSQSLLDCVIRLLRMSRGRLPKSWVD